MQYHRLMDNKIDITDRFIKGAKLTLNGDVIGTVESVHYTEQREDGPYRVHERTITWMAQPEISQFEAFEIMHRQNGTTNGKREG